MPTIVISYRRTDSSAVAGRIFDRLIAHYGEESIFLDIDNIPFGIDFRTHINEILQRTDVVLAIIGANWLGVGPDGCTRMSDPTDPVRFEIETAIARRMPIIPVLVDGAKMPDSTDLPAEFGNFAYLNAAEVATGREFRNQMDRLIAAIERAVTGDVGSALPHSRTAAAGRESSPSRIWLRNVLSYLSTPLVLILVVHHIIINAFDMNVAYLWVACAVVPFIFGFVFFRANGGGAGAAFAVATALGVTAAVGMTVSQTLSSGDPILPQNRYEWRDNTQFTVGIALSFLAGHALARALKAARSRKFVKR
jgi:TIR domain